MKEGWTYKKLGEICRVINGRAYSKDEMLSQGKYRLLRVGNFFTNDSWYYSDLELEEDKYCDNGDLLYAWSASFGPRIWDGEKVIYHYHIWKMVCSAEIDKYFLCYWLDSDELKKQTMTNLHGATMAHITKRIIENAIVSYPSLSEQQSIVDYLDSAFAKIDAMKVHAEKALNEAKALFQASLKEMLEPKEEVKWSTIGDLFETYSGGTPTKSNKEYYEGGLIPWLRSGEVCQKEITRTEMFITEKGLKESSAKYYPENTVVVAMYGATAAQVGILRIKSTSNQAVCGILPHKDFLPDFVYYWFSSIEDKLAAQAQGGAQPNISQQKIKKVEIPIYSITEQQSIVATLDSLKSKVDRLKANYAKISQECAALKQAILRQVFE